MASLRKNTISFAVLQASEYLVPVFAIPFLIRVLGVSSYGKIAFAQAICAYFVILTEYGFNFTASRDAAILRADPRGLNRLFWDVLGARALLFFGSLLIALAISLALKNILGELLLISMLTAAGAAIYPVWMLQGIERIQTAALIVAVVRSSFLVALYLLVKTSADINLAGVLLFGSSLASAIALLIYVFAVQIVSFDKVTFKRAIGRLIAGRHAFFATAGSSLYRSTNAAVLGIASGVSQVAFYSVAEKIIRAAQETNRPIAMATYPRLSATLHASRESARPLLLRVVILIGGVGALMTAGLFLFAPQIIRLVVGNASPEAVSVLKIMALAPVIGSFNLVFGAQVMHSLGQSRAFARFVIVSGIASAVFIVPATLQFGAAGAATVYVTCEALLLCNLIVFHRRKRML